MRTATSKLLVLLATLALPAMAQAPDPEVITRLEEKIQQLEKGLSDEIAALRAVYRNLEAEVKNAQDDQGAKAVADLTRVLEPVLTEAGKLGAQRTRLNRKKVVEYLQTALPSAIEGVEHPLLIPLKPYLERRIAAVMKESGDVLDSLTLEAEDLSKLSLREILEFVTPFHIQWNTAFSSVLPQADSYRAVFQELEAARVRLAELRDPYLRFQREAPEGFAWVPPGDYVIHYSGPFAGRGTRKKPKSAQVRGKVGIGLKEVTHAEYYAWLAEMVPDFFKQHMPKGPDGTPLWVTDKETGLMGPAAELRDHPVTGISLRSALAYAASRGARLPTEAEWCAAAQGKKRRIYPWGDEYLAARCNDREAEIKGTQPVGSYEDGRGPFGHYDLAGNVSEWVLTYESGKNADPAHLDDANAAVRGGSFRQDRNSVTTGWFWLRRALHETDIDVGFRLAIDGK